MSSFLLLVLVFFSFPGLFARFSHCFKSFSMGCIHVSVSLSGSGANGCCGPLHQKHLSTTNVTRPAVFRSLKFATTQSTVSTRWPTGASGDRQKKVVAGGQSSGNRRGSEVPFASRLQEIPGVALFCDGCGHDWRHFPRSRGVARGCVDEDNAVVTVMQEKHWKCNKRCKPAAGAKVRIGGVEYTVKSAQDGQFRAQSA